jgi:hypothetical protein
VTDYPKEVGVEAGDCYFCHTGKCPVGVTTQDPELIKRLDVESAALRVYNLLHSMTLECQMLARGCGKTDIHNLEPEDLAALTIESAAMTGLPLAGTNWVPGQEPTLQKVLEKLESLERRLSMSGETPMGLPATAPIAGDEAVISVNMPQ